MQPVIEAIIIVEDCVDHKDLAVRAFKNLKPMIQVVCVSSIAEAVEELHKKRFDIVITDMCLPDGMGISLVPETESPVIVMTAYGDEEGAVRALKAGVFDYVVKSNDLFNDMPFIVDRVFREWQRMIARKRTDEAIRENEHRLTLALEAANDGMWDFNPLTKKTYYSARWFTMLGYEPEELVASYDTFLNLLHPDDVPFVRKKYESFAVAGDELSLEFRMRAKHGEWRWIYARGKAVQRDAEGRVIRVVGTHTDITDRKAVEQRLEFSANHDLLTGLPNRRLFCEHLDRVIARARRNKDFQFSVLFVDLDRFKDVNDSLGHFAGDKVLQKVGEQLLAGMRSHDVVARFAGDEFVAVLDGITGIDEVWRIADRLRESLSRPIRIEGQDICLSGSFGFVVSGNDSKVWTAEELLRDADTAMYRAKIGGKNRCEMFDERMHVSAVRQFRIEMDLRKAIERKEFYLVYQPIRCLKTGTLLGVEALLRWRHPERGEILPDEFIPQAEVSGQIIPIGAWVLDRAINEVKRWHDVGHHVFLSVNLSVVQLHDKDFCRTVERICQRVGYDMKYLCLEITEHVAMSQGDIAFNTLDQLKQQVHSIALDDFGVGYASLNYLKRFPISMLKIDKSFIRDSVQNHEAAEIVKAIIVMAHALRISVIAEGVETKEQYDFLKENFCDAIQGYYYSVPVPAEDVLSMLVLN